MADFSLFSGPSNNWLWKTLLKKTIKFQCFKVKLMLSLKNKRFCRQLKVKSSCKCPTATATATAKATAIRSSTSFRKAKTRLFTDHSSLINQSINQTKFASVHQQKISFNNTRQILRVSISKKKKISKSTRQKFTLY